MDIVEAMFEEGTRDDGTPNKLDIPDQKRSPPPVAISSDA
jgi:hypothetical protein